MAQLPVENLYDPMGNATGLPVEQPSVPVQMPTQTSSVVDQVINKLFRDDEKRYQLWPEKIVRDALDAPNAAMTGRMPMYQVVDGELRTSPEVIKAGLDMSALAGTGGLGGADASLGSTPFLRPALKYGEKIYKGKPGQQHLDVLPQELVPEFQKLAMSGEDISKYNFGFMNHKGQFLDREAALKYAIDEGLMSPHDAKFGALTSTMFADSSKPAVATKVAELSDWYLANHGRPPTQIEINNVMKTRAGQIQRDITAFNKAEGADTAYAPKEELKQIKQYLKENQ